MLRALLQGDAAGFEGQLFVDAGARRISVWPLGEEVAQLERFRERVTNLLPRQA
jgi:hypothetical protein